MAELGAEVGFENWGSGELRCQKSAEPEKFSCATASVFLMS